MSIRAYNKNGRMVDVGYESRLRLFGLRRWQLDGAEWFDVTHTTKLHAEAELRRRAERYGWRVEEYKLRRLSPAEVLEGEE